MIYARIIGILEMPSVCEKTQQVKKKLLGCVLIMTIQFILSNSWWILFLTLSDWTLPHMKLLFTLIVYLHGWLNFHCCVFDASSDTPLDLKIKASMISDMFSVVGEFLIFTSQYTLFNLHLLCLCIHVVREVNS